MTWFRFFVFLIGAGLTGMTAEIVRRYRRSRRMLHILPLGVSYLLLALLSLESLYVGRRESLSWDGALLGVSYALGATGLFLLIRTSHEA